MPETGATYVPRPLTDIESDPITEAFAALVHLAAGYVVAGLDLTYTGLTAHIAPGRAIVLTDADPPSAYYVFVGTQVDETLANNATNYLYLNATADIIVNQTGIAPANSIPLFTVVTSGGAVTGTPGNVRSSVINIGAALKTVGLDLTSTELTHLGAPTVVTSAARLQDVQDYVAGVGGVKNPVRAATTAAITLSGLQTVDGVALASQDRVLVKNQAAGATNGIYVAQSGSWVRATDYDSAGEILGGTLIAVSEGTVNGNSVFGQDTDNPVVVGTTALAFTRKDVQAHELLTSAHSSASAATPSRIVERDSAGRAKFVAAAAAGDALIHGQTAAGDLTGTYPSPTIAANAVGDTKIRQGVARSVIGRSGSSTGNVADIQASANGDVLRRTGGVLGFGPITTESFVINSVDNTVLADMVQATVKGRAAAAGTGDPVDLTAAQLVTILTAADGAGSLLDADLLDGFDSAAAASANTIAKRGSGGRLKVGDPSATDDAATKNYVDNFIPSPIDRAYNRDAADWVIEGVLDFYGDTIDSTRRISTNGIEGLLGPTSAAVAAGATIGPNQKDARGNGIMDSQEAWTDGDKLEVVLAFSIDALPVSPALSGIGLRQPINAPPSDMSKTTPSVMRIDVGVDSLGDIYLISSDGTAVTSADTGLNYTPGTLMKVKFVFIKGTNVVVTVDANSPITRTTNLPNRVGTVILAKGGTAAANSGRTRGGFWRITGA